jgi:hypothetical protein
MKSQVISQLTRLSEAINRPANSLEGIGLHAQSDKLDEAGQLIDDVLETLESL